MIWASNRGFAEWASVFGNDEVHTPAILDRLLHDSTVVRTDGSAEPTWDARGCFADFNTPCMWR